MPPTWTAQEEQQLPKETHASVRSTRWSMLLIHVSVQQGRKKVGPMSPTPWSNCRTPDQTKIKIRSNQKSGEALYLGGWLFVRRNHQNSSDVTLAFEDAD